MTLEKIIQTEENSKLLPYPRLAANLAEIGVTGYKFRVLDSSTVYSLASGETLVRHPATDRILVIDPNTHLQQLTEGLGRYRQGEVDYGEFCWIAAKSGVAYWIADLVKNKGIKYYSLTDELIYSEKFSG
jgi:hypothetical protein